MIAGRVFWLKWTIACLAGASGGYILATWVAIQAGKQWPGDPIAAVGVPIGLVLGAICLGAAQAIVLSRFIRGAAWWVGATAGGVAVPVVATLIAILLLLEGAMASPGGSLRYLNLVPIAVILGGLLVGVFQALVVRGQVRRPRLWVWGSTLAIVVGLVVGQLAMVMLLGFIGPLTLALRGEQGAFISAGVFGVVFGLVYGAISGWVWLWLQRGGAPLTPGDEAPASL